MHLADKVITAFHFHSRSIATITWYAIDPSRRTGRYERAYKDLLDELNTTLDGLSDVFAGSVVIPAIEDELS